MKRVLFYNRLSLRAGSLRCRFNGLRPYLQQPVCLSVAIITHPILADIVKQVHPAMRYRTLTVDDAIAVLEFTELYVNPLKPNQRYL